MARQNIDEKWKVDPRRKALVKRIGDRNADGMRVEINWLILDYKGKPIPYKVFQYVENAQDWIECGLAEVRGDEVFVAGADAYDDYFEKQRANGSKGGRPPKPIEPRETQPNPTISESNPKNPSPSFSSSISNSEKKKNIAQPDGFADFWAGYPRKVGKGKAHRAYLRELKSGTDPAQLIQARDKYLNHLRQSGTEAQYVKHGSTFMNEWRDWLDPEAGKAEGFAQAAGVDWAALEKELT